MMNNDAVQELINGIGLMSELWIITYNSFRSHGMNDGEAMTHTREFMGTVVDTVMRMGKQEDNK